MSQPIHLVTRCEVLRGKAEAARKAIGDIVGLCESNEPDLRMYEYYFNDDTNDVVILETFKGNDEIVSHSKNTRSHPEVFNAFFDAIRINSVGFYGPVSAEIITDWADLNPTPYKHHDGFTRKDSTEFDRSRGQSTSFADTAVKQPIHFVARFKVLPGRADAARDAIDGLVAVCKPNEPNLLMYEFYIDEDQTEVVSLETFWDSEAILGHGKNAHAHSYEFDAFFRAVSVTGLDIFGPVSDEVMSGWAQYHPTAYRHHAGFTR